MRIVNAIAKVRFASARPQRIRLDDERLMQAEMLCMESGQQAAVRAGQWLYYVVMGQVTLTAGDQTAQLSAGQLAVTDMDESHTLANTGEQRLVCLALECLGTNAEE